MQGTERNTCGACEVKEMDVMDVLEGVDTEVIISHLEACGYEVETKESGVSDDIKDLELKIHELRNKQEEAYEVLKDLKAIHYMAVEDEAKDR
jgi:hypothetical protein